MDSDSTLSHHVHRAGETLVRRLLVVHTPDLHARGRTILLDGATQTAGRHGHVEGPLAFEDPTLSREHAVVEPNDRGWQVRDLGSHNGTFVHGRRIDANPLESGAVLRVGDNLLLYEEIVVQVGEGLIPPAPPLFGSSVALQRVRAQLDAAARGGGPALLLGESGVGKEVAARAFHVATGDDGPFIAVNCAALPRDLAESELFGHAAGAFSGADRAHDGLFRAAHGGTIFLDEIGEMPPTLQPKLLRALADGHIRPVGEDHERAVDVRVVAATNRDLREAIDTGQFRGDLFSRLSAHVVEIPPLRRRRSDILDLVTHLAPGLPPLSADAAEAMLLFDWPYNVRELSQVLDACRERAASAPELSLDQLPRSVAAPVRDRTPATGIEPEIPLALLVDPRVAPDRDALVTVLRRCHGRVSDVADFFGKKRPQVYRWLERFDLDVDDYR